MNDRTSDNLGDIESRKGAHIELCLDPGSQAEGSVFEQYRLPYTALPEISFDEVDTSFELCGKRLSMPLIIGSMTGGSEHGRNINTNLATAAGQCGVALAVGSQRIGLEKPDAEDTFKLVRRLAPKACIIANMGAVQLNYGHGVDSFRRVVDMIEADALYLHLNPLQEALQPGGDTDFRGLAEKIHKVVRTVGVPVFIKEVGHGISAKVARTLFSLGVRAIDVAGVGGTSYAWVEAKRAQNEDFTAWFKDFGIPTDRAVIEVSNARTAPSTQLVIASGGVRSPVDGLKSRVLGADCFSAAVPFLHPAMDSSEATVATIENWKMGLKVAMFASGARDWEEAGNLGMRK